MKQIWNFIHFKSEHRKKTPLCISYPSHPRAEYCYQPGSRLVLKYQHWAQCVKETQVSQTPWGACTSSVRGIHALVMDGTMEVRWATLPKLLFSAFSCLHTRAHYALLLTMVREVNILVNSLQRPEALGDQNMMEKVGWARRKASQAKNLL